MLRWPTVPAALPQPPHRLGRYEIEEPLAHGGMAELFIARLAGPEGFARRVVVKRVLPALAREREFVDMFLHEARLAASLDHRNIVAVHDIGHDEAGFFLVMELLHGADVGSILRAADAELALALALDIACGACAGLHYAHERQAADGTPLGLVHRDVSPQNLFVTFDGSTKLLDFGIAKATDRIADLATRSGTLRGKVPYMSPEQCRAEPLDRRSDVFSLGIVLWELSVGARLYGGNGEGDFEIFKQIAEREAPPPGSRRAGYPAELDRIVTRALQRDRAARYQTVAELHDDLESVVRARSLAISPREVGTFVATLFPARADAWRRGDRLAGPGEPRQPDRATVELPRSNSAPGRVESEPPPASSPSGAPAASPWSRRWLVAVAIGSLGLAIGLGFLVGQRTPAAGPPAGAEAPRPTATAEPAPPAEDAHWFQPDDYLISATPYRDGRLDGLRVAKLLGPIDRATGIGRFLDGNAHESTTAAYWKSHIARADELTLGARAVCRADSYMLASAGPRDKADARTQNWTLARVTDIAERAAGRVTIGDVVCDLSGVRIPE
jgi:serine/threonine protein kinase